MQTVLRVGFATLAVVLSAAVFWETGAGRSAAQGTISVRMEQLQGNWTWWTNPDEKSHKWSGGFHIALKDSKSGNIAVTQDGVLNEGIVAGNGVTWKRKIGDKQQRWSATLIIGDGGHFHMRGKWSGDFSEGNSDSDFEFVAHKN